MNLLRGPKTALALVLILGFLPILGAQSPSQGPAIEDLLPGSRETHFPESSISKATVGTLSGDADAFMSPVDWGSIENMDSSFVLAGVDEWGLSLGYARKLGKAYLGASYSGDLIDELYRRITNKDTESLWKNTQRSSAGITGPSLVDQNDQSVPGLVISNNDINIIFGVGIFGVRLGFAEWIRSVQNSSDTPYWSGENSLESSLKPNLEVGFNIQAGKVTIKPAIRAAFDIHEFESVKGYLETDYSSSPIVQYWVVRQDRINFWEPSAGLSLGVEVALSDATSIEFGLEGDAAYRMYREPGDPDSILSRYTYDSTANDFPTFPLNYDDISSMSGVTSLPLIGDVTIPMDLRATGAPSFAFTSDIGERLTLGAKIAIDGGFNFLILENEDSATSTKYTTTVMAISVAPDVALGASFHLIPDHFSLHAGIGLQLFSYSHLFTNFDTEVAGTTTSAPEVTDSSLGLPTARFGGGLTVNFTQAVALDAMAFSSGLDFDSTLFNLLLTIKK
jgi:hypothetical protein